MNNQKIFILGDSHTQALKIGYDNHLKANNTENFPAFDINWLFIEKNGKARGELKLEDGMSQISRLNSHDMVVLSFLGTAHNIFGLLQHEEAFDFYSPDMKNAEIEETSSVIPYACMSNFFEEILNKNKSISKIESCSPCPVYHLSTPAPKQSSEFITSKIVKYRGKLASEVGISKPELRLKLWKLEMSILHKLCKEWKVEYISVPEKSVCDQGYLKPEYFGNDATHANPDYGMLVLEKLASL